MAAHAQTIYLSNSDRAVLERLQRASAGPAGVCKRARVVLLLADAMSGVEVAKLTGYTEVQVSRIRSRFCAEGIGGLHDRPRCGRPPRVTDRHAAKVVALTLREPPSGLSHWSSSDIAESVGLSASTVQRIWRAHALQPHRVLTFKFTKDPKAEQKILDVVGLYLNPPSNAAVFCVDEKTQIQALSRTQPLLQVRPGLAARHTHDYRRNGLTSLYAALNVASGKIVGACSKTHTGADFLRFVKRLTRKCGTRQIHVVLDNSSTHSTPPVREWLDKHPNVTFHFTPTGASWLNMIEAWFGILTRKSVRRGSFDSVRALIDHIDSYIARWNENPKPFVWTRSPEDIIRKAVRRS